MDNFWEKEFDVASLLENIYRCADKSSWYSSVAKAYDHARPRYPAKLMEKLQGIAQLGSGKKVLEIGCGPGIATVDIAKIGVDLICLEPSLAACQIAQQNCAEYNNVNFVNSTFENWELDEAKFDLILATTSFHWIDPDIRTKKIAASLNQEGIVALLWNTPPQVNYATYQTIANVYQTHVPNLAKYETPASHQTNLNKMGQELINSDLFQNLQQEQVINQVIYSVEDYLTLLSTLSPYIKLETEQRNILFVELAKALQSKCGNQLELSYLSMMQIAHKKADLETSS